MLLKFRLELIRGGPELSTELLHLTKNSLWNFLAMFKALQFLRFWVYQKILLDFFVELIGGEEISEQNCWIRKKKIFSKFFGYLQSTVVSWILSLSKNVTRVIPRTHPGGTRTLNRTLAFNKKFRFKFFGYVYSSVVPSILNLSKNLTGLFCRTHLGGNRTLNRTAGIEKKHFEIFWVRSKYCSFLDFEFIETCY